VEAFEEGIGDRQVRRFELRAQLGFETVDVQDVIRNAKVHLRRRAVLLNFEHFQDVFFLALRARLRGRRKKFQEVQLLPFEIDQLLSRQGASSTQKHNQDCGENSAGLHRASLR